MIFCAMSTPPAPPCSHTRDRATGTPHVRQAFSIHSISAGVSLSNWFSATTTGREKVSCRVLIWCSKLGRPLFKASKFSRERLSSAPP